MRVLHVINGLGASGAEIMLFNLAVKLRDMGVDQDVLTLMPGGSLEQRFRAEGFSPTDIGMKQGIPSLSAFNKLREQVRKSQADVILGWMYHSCWAVSLAAPRGTPVVWGLHHTLTKLSSERPLTRFLIQFGTVFKRSVSHYVYVSNTSAEQHFALGYPQLNATVIPNGFDMQRFVPDSSLREAVRAELGIPGNAVVFGAAARFHPMKNQVGLVKAFVKATAGHGNAVLVMAGRGVDTHNADLVRAQQAETTGGRVLLLGERSDMTRLMNAFDFYVSPSGWGESFPLVLGEAMASGVPCITTDLGDCAYIVGDTGVVIPPGDDGALVDALCGALAMDLPARAALGCAARRRIEERFSLDPVAERYLAVLRNAVARP